MAMETEIRNRRAKSNIGQYGLCLCLRLKLNDQLMGRYQLGSRSHIYRFRGVLVSTRSQFVLSLPSPYLLQALLVLGSGCDGYDVDGLRLKEPGEEGADDPGVVFAVAEATVLLDRTTVAAAAGLQCAQMEMLKPRPSQLVQTAPLYTS